MRKSLLTASILCIVLLISAAFIFTGCASSRTAMDESAAVAEDGYYAEGAKMAETTAAASMPESAEEMGTDTENSGGVTPSVSLKIIKSAYISIQVEKDTFQNKMLELTVIAERNGGFVSNTESYSNPEGNISSGRIVIRVPGEKFNSVVEEIKKVGDVKAISISGQDVTQEYVDLESRLRNYEAQEKVLLDLMAKSTDVSDSIEVQKELSNVQGEIEVIKGRMNYLDNMVSLSTIDINLYEPEIAAPVEGGGFINAVRRGVEGAVKVLNGIAFFFIAISPLLVLAGIIILIVWGSIRGRNKRRAKKAAQTSQQSSEK